jgi:hypothetical protein
MDRTIFLRGREHVSELRGLLRVQIWRIGRSQDVSSSVPVGTRTTPSFGGLAAHDPHSGQTHRVLGRPLSAMALERSRFNPTETEFPTPTETEF